MSKSSKDLIIQHVGDETIIFDRKNNVAHRTSRRDFMRNLGIAASAALAIPIIESFAVPADAQREPLKKCFGKHVTSVNGVGATKHAARENVYAASVARAEAICADLSCDEGRCVSTGHPFTPLKPSCTKLKDNSWKCTLRYSAVCRCSDGQGGD